MRHFLPTLSIAFCVSLVAWGLYEPQPLQAMPNFSRALGVSCDTCHTMVPALNAYGRLVQRTFYQTINSKTLRNTLPIYIEQEIQSYSYGGKDAAEPGRKITIGNLIASFDGAASPVFTYRVENNIYGSDQPTNQSKGPETMWLAYHGLFGGYGHLLVGDDYPGPVPAFMDNPSDFEAAFLLRHFAEGLHSYNLMNTRLTFRFDYEKGPLDAEIAWRGGSNNPIAGLPSDFGGAGIDKAIQWMVADAPPSKPFSFGLFGISGNYTLNGKAKTPGAPPNVDYYNMYGPFFQLDPGWLGKYVPGIEGFYANNHDSNPGIVGYTTLAPMGPHGTDESIEILEPVLKKSLMFTAREELATNGLGARMAAFDTGFSYEIPSLPYMFVRFEVPIGASSTAPNGRPTWQWVIDTIIPIDSGPLNRIEGKSQPALAATGPAAGASIYAAKCASCHGASGQGIPGTFPALAGNLDVTAANPNGIIATVVHGKGVMPAWRSQLSNADIAAVLTYIRSSWGNSAGAVTESDVAGVQ